MKKIAYRVFAILLCAALLSTGTAFAAPAEVHDHDDHALERIATPVRAGLLWEPAGEEPAPETPVPEATPHVHEWVKGYAEAKAYTCDFGVTWIYYDRCATCGALNPVAYRPEYSGNEQGSNKQAHNFVETTVPGVCPMNPRKEYHCTNSYNGIPCSYWYSEGTGEHQWSDWKSEGPYCTDPDVRTCLLCGATENRNANRVHVWGEVQKTGSCDTGWTLYHVCTTCGYREDISTTTGHSWVHFEEPSDCTHTGRSGQRCQYCGVEQNVVTLPITHFPNADDGDCRTAVTCSKCGAITTPAKSSHNFGTSWKHDDTNHWQVCQNPGCKATSAPAAHTLTVSKNCTQPAYCSVCGYKSGTALYTSHDYTGDYVIASTTYHTRKCAHPGCTSVSAPIPHEAANDTPDRLCTEDVECVCGYPMRRGSSAHTWGPWVATGNGHTRTCTKCHATETGSHTGSSNGSCTSAVNCTVCGHVLVHAFASHSFGVWVASANGTTHYRTCTRAGCTAIESTTHSGGTATCKSAAICSTCGVKYGSKNASNHVGGTEVRNYKAPGIGVAGYTGDTYCLGCGAVLARGTSIAMLSENHTHKYGSWESDSVHHWKQCECSERSEFAAHSFANGACTVCGAKDPNYQVCSGSLHVGGTEIKNVKAAAVGVDGYTGDTYCLACGAKIASGTVIAALEEDHIHNFSSGWKSDSHYHWHECNCGERTAQAAHVYGANDRCVYCGAIDPNASAKQEAHVHVYGALVSNGQDHWRECTICGEQADRAHHMILDGKCMDCGFVKVETAALKDLKESDWYYDSVRRVVETGLIAAMNGDTFEPKAAVGRGQIADILYRLAGSPISDGSSEFADVSAEETYRSAISWAANNSIMLGQDAAFNPEQNVTVEEVITVLWRYAAMLDEDGVLEEQDALEWAASTGLMEGYEVQPDPAGEATRTDVAVLVANFMKSMEILSDESPTDLT